MLVFFGTVFAIVIYTALLFRFFDWDNPVKQMKNRKAKTKDKPKAIAPNKPKRDFKGMSWPAREIVKSWDVLPEEHRPAYDIVALVRALDLKYDNADVNHHFRSLADFGYYNDSPCYSWVCHCLESDHEDFHYDEAEENCPYKPYRDLHDELNHIQHALWDREMAYQEQKRRMEIAGVQAELDSIDDMLAALRNESQAIREITREIEDA